MCDEVLIRKAAAIADCLAGLRAIRAGAAADLAQQDLLLLRLQRAAIAAGGMADRIIKLHRLPIPMDREDSIQIVARAGIIDPALGPVMEQLVGWRNAAFDEEPNLAGMRAFLDAHLDDFLTFSRALLAADPSAASAPFSP